MKAKIFETGYGIPKVGNIVMDPSYDIGGQLYFKIISLDENTYNPTEYSILGEVESNNGEEASSQNLWPCKIIKEHLQSSVP